MFARRLGGWVMTAVAFWAFLALWAACTSQLPEPTRAGEPPAPRTAVSVVRVVDGDTIVVTGTNGVTGKDRETVRLIGVDTPETVHPSKPVQCYGPEATKATKTLLPVGSAAFLTFDKGTTTAQLRDRTPSRRLLAYVWRTNDQMVNSTLVRQGYAKASYVPPQDDYRARFKALEAEAKAKHKGLWGAC